MSILKSDSLCKVYGTDVCEQESEFRWRFLVVLVSVV